ncbi:hypothetical protein [Deinococcus irradiatisoli]|uniref:hypothetical protein n=1 Tax=Deinococcus irradiatisoli TaxID=2202254 RepID=UPI0015E8488D|nr:hypothetical protein [Deinococcus irradiatisoli]
MKWLLLIVLYLLALVIYSHFCVVMTPEQAVAIALGIAVLTLGGICKVATS